MTPKILSVSLLTTKEHPYKVKKNLQGSFLKINLYSIFAFVINYEKTALQIFFMSPEIRPKSFGTFEKQAPGPNCSIVG